MFTGSTPDITPAQIAAVVAFVVGQFVAWGVLDGTREKVYVSAGVTLVSVAWKLADAYLRGQRAKALALSGHVAPVDPTTVAH